MRDPIAKDVRCAILLALCLAGCIVVAPKPKPDDGGGKPTPTQVEVAAKQAMHDYAVNLAVVFRDVSGNVPATASDLNKTLHDRDMDARKQAFLPLDKIVDQRLRPYDAEKARVFLLEMATAFEGVK